MSDLREDFVKAIRDVIEMARRQPHGTSAETILTEIADRLAPAEIRAEGPFFRCTHHGPLYGLASELVEGKTPACGACVTPPAPPRQPEVSMPDSTVEDVEASLRSILTDVVADRLVERVVETVKTHLDEHARIVDERYRTSPGTARLVDVNFEPREGSVLNWAAKHPGRTTCVRLSGSDVRLIFEGEDGSRSTVSLFEHRQTGRVTDE